MSWMKTVLCVCLVFLGIASCTTSPTGRSQFLMVDDKTLAPQAAESFEKMKEQEKVSTNKRANDYVQCVVQPLIEEAKYRYDYLPDSWEVVVFDSESVNAFAMPGGKVGVFTGMIDLAENQDQLAAVVGHEIGHVVAQHSAERVSTAQMTVLAMTAAGVALADTKEQAMIMAALGLGAQVGIQLPFSRTHESEADYIGQELMARAGFKPAGAVELWKIMDKEGGARPPELLSTHPAPQSRAMKLSQNLPQMTALYETAQSAGKRPQCKMPKKPVTTKKTKQKSSSEKKAK